MNVLVSPCPISSAKNKNTKYAERQRERERLQERERTAVKKSYQAALNATAVGSMSRQSRDPSFSPASIVWCKVNVKDNLSTAHVGVSSVPRWHLQSANGNKRTAFVEEDIA